MAVAWMMNLLPGRMRAAWHYRRGMVRAKLGQHAAALDDYREVVEFKEVDDNLLAMTLHNRALVYDATGDRAAAISDLQRLLSLPGVGERIKVEARRRLLRMDHKTARSEAEGIATTKRLHGAQNETSP